MLVVKDYFAEFVNSDWGRQCESEIVQRLCQLLGITKTCTAPYRPKSDDMVERFNRTLISQLIKALLATGGEWNDCLRSEVCSPLEGPVQGLGSFGFGGSTRSCLSDCAFPGPKWTGEGR